MHSDDIYTSTVFWCNLWLILSPGMYLVVVIFSRFDGTKFHYGQRVDQGRDEVAETAKFWLSFCFEHSKLSRT
jgi:hypothetical protein